VVEEGKRTNLEVLLFWKDDVRTEQTSIRVEAENSDGRWRIDRVSRMDGRVE
jgi:hypothetical protein